jgi:hypothetical protein
LCSGDSCRVFDIDVEGERWIRLLEALEDHNSRIAMISVGMSILEVQGLRWLCVVGHASIVHCFGLLGGDRDPLVGGCRRTYWFGRCYRQRIQPYVFGLRSLCQE